MIYVRLYIESYDAATSDLSALEDGMYFRLLRHYFKTEKPIEVGREHLITRALRSVERKAVDLVLGRFFVKEADGWHNARADHEISVANQARTNGSRGGRPSEQGARSDSAEVTGQLTGLEESGYQSGYENPSETQTGSGQPVKPKQYKTNQHHPSQPTPPLSADASHGGRKPLPVDTRATWESYRGAYLGRYGVEPVRNARVNGQLASLVRFVGAAEAPAIAAFYVGHNRAKYVQATHATSMLARDAEGLRTEWATNRRGSEAEAVLADRTQATGNAFRGLLEEAEAGPLALGPSA